jgi:pimeloyl-ACP methyl ester carboxylesterase
MVRKLALCSAYVKLEEVIEYVFQKLIYLLPTISFEKVIELFLPWVFSRALWKKPDVIKKIHNEIFFTPLRKLLTHLFKDKIMTMVSEQLEAAKLFNAKTCTSKIQIPTLILSGGDDLLFPTHHPKELHKLISGSTLKILPHVAHDLRIECPRRFFEETRAFFL